MDSEGGEGEKRGGVYGCCGAHANSDKMGLWELKILPRDPEAGTSSRRPKRSTVGEATGGAKGVTQGVRSERLGGGFVVWCQATPPTRAQSKCHWAELTSPILGKGTC